MFRNKENQKTFFSETLADAEEKLKEKNERFLHIAFGAIASGEPELVRRSGRAIGTLLKAYDMQKMIRLSETFRQYTSMEWFIDWNAIYPGKMMGWFESADDYRYILILGSFHPNGYFRERCLCGLEEFPNSLPFMILRMNDWVENIRCRAADMVCRHIQSCRLEEIFYAAQAMDKLRCSGRRKSADLSQAEALMEKRLKQEAGAISAREILSFDFGVRRSIYRYLFSGSILELEKAEQLMDREKHSFCQIMIITGILKHYNCPMEKVDSYLLHKNACVRRKALEYKYTMVKSSWPGLESMLLDSNKGIRDFAGFILERCENYDTLAFYLEHLKDENPLVSIIETGERGDRGLAGLLTPFLNHPRDKVVKYTIMAIGSLAGSEAEELFWSYLFDRRPAISKAACYSAVKNGVCYGSKPLYKAIQACDARWTKGFLVNLLMREPCWERIPYLLQLRSEPDLEEFHDKMLEGLHGRNLYCKITESQGQAILNALEVYGGSLPQCLVDEIRFDLRFVMKHKGVDTYDTAGH